MTLVSSPDVKFPRWWGVNRVSLYLGCIFAAAVGMAYGSTSVPGKGVREEIKEGERKDKLDLHDFHWSSEYEKDAKFAL